MLLIWKISRIVWALLAIPRHNRQPALSTEIASAPNGAKALNTRFHFASGFMPLELLNAENGRGYCNFPRIGWQPHFTCSVNRASTAARLSVWPKTGYSCCVMPLKYTVKATSLTPYTIIPYLALFFKGEICFFLKIIILYKWVDLKRII